jgi:hypothetical protein
MEAVFDEASMGGFNAWPDVVVVTVAWALAFPIVTSVTCVITSGIDQEDKMFCLISCVLGGFAYKCRLFVHCLVRFAFLDAMSGLFAVEAYACEGASFYIWDSRNAVTVALSRLLSLIFSFALFALEFAFVVVLPTMLSLSSTIASAFAFVFAFLLSLAFVSFARVGGTGLLWACMGGMRP